MSLIPPPKVEKLQAALHTKAKESPDYRFYALYDKLYRKDILRHAFYRCLANQGVAGVDGVTFEWIEAYGEERWLDELAEDLRQQTYRTQPVLRVNILGYTLGRCYNHRTGAAYLAASPAKKKIAKLCDAIGEQTSSRRTQLDEEKMVGRLNRKLRGWANYFDLGAVSRAYDAVNHHVTNRLRRWLCRKHKVRGQGYSQYPDRYLYRELGLYQLKRPRRSFPNATV